MPADPTSAASPFEEPRREENRTILRLSAFDRMFVSIVREKGGMNRVLLWSELMSIASYLMIPTLERLIRTVLVLDEANQFQWHQKEEEEGEGGVVRKAKRGRE